MKKNILLFIAFTIAWAALIAAAYLLNILFNQNWFDGWQEYVVFGLSGAVGGVFGPILSAWLMKKLKNRTAR